MFLVGTGLMRLTGKAKPSLEIRLSAEKHFYQRDERRFFTILLKSFVS